MFFSPLFIEFPPRLISPFSPNFRFRFRLLLYHGMHSDARRKGRSVHNKFTFCQRSTRMRLSPPTDSAGILMGNNRKRRIFTLLNWRFRPRGGSSGPRGVVAAQQTPARTGVQTGACRAATAVSSSCRWGRARCYRSSTGRKGRSGSKSSSCCFQTLEYPLIESYCILCRFE